MKTFEFTKAHVYGGVKYPAGSKIVIPDRRAADLEAAKVGKIEVDEDKPKKSARGKS